MKTLAMWVSLTTAAVAQTPIGFADENNWLVPLAGAQVHSLASGDLDADGDLDVVVTSLSSADSIAIFVGDGLGQFVAGPVLDGVGVSPRSLLVEDLDADGWLDLVHVATDAGAVVVHRGLGTLTFATPLSLPAGAQPWAVVAADFDVDGRADLAVCDATGNRVGLLRSTGVLQFAAVQWFGVGARPISLAAGRIDGDTLPDLAVANLLGGSLSILVGQGGAHFAPAQTLPLGAFPYDVVLADFNSDAHLDLVTANGSTALRGASTLAGDGLGGFGAPTHLDTTAARTNSVEVVDLYADTHPDLLFALNPQAIGVRLGRGDGTFADQTNFTRAQSDPWEAHAADLEPRTRLRRRRATRSACERRAQTAPGTRAIANRAGATR